MLRLWTVKRGIFFFACAYMLSFMILYTLNIPGLNTINIDPRRVERIWNPGKPIEVSLHNSQHHNLNLFATFIRSRVSILCWIMTSPKTLYTKAAHLKATWTQACDKVVFISSVEDAKFPAVGIGGKEGMEYLWVKTRRSLQYLYDNHSKHADWFLKADDDTFVILENLRLFLSDKDPSQALFYGRRFKVAQYKWGYMSGGAGYVMSRAALERVVTDSFPVEGRCPSEATVDQTPGIPEDLALGFCMDSVNVTLGDTRDSSGRERFQPFPPMELLDPYFLPATNFWLWDYSYYKPTLKVR